MSTEMWMFVEGIQTLATGLEVWGSIVISTRL